MTEPTAYNMDSTREQFFHWLSGKVSADTIERLASYDWDILLNTDIDGFTSIIGDRLVAGAVYNKIQQTTQTGNDFVTRALGT